MKTLIVIPARYASTRFPQKPLHKIAGRSLLGRVTDIASAACARQPDRSYVVATDHEAIRTHAETLGAPVVMTDSKLPSGTDRALAAAKLAAPDADFPLTVKMVDKSEPVTVTVSPTSTVGDLITRLTAKGVRPKILAFAGKRLLPGDTGQQLQAAGVRRGGPVAICVGSRVSSSSGTAPTACAQNADSNSKKLSKEKLEEFKAAFTLFDRNGDGFLDASELKATMAGLGERVTDAQAAEMIVAADSNGDGKLDFGEFVAMMGGASEKRLREGGAAANEPPPAKKAKQGGREAEAEAETAAVAAAAAAAATVAANADFIRMYYGDTYG